ncbi:uncharacterized protein LOC144459172 isoform X2 [Epinephelus lanceolatus]
MAEFDPRGCLETQVGASPLLTLPELACTLAGGWECVASEPCAIIRAPRWEPSAIKVVGWWLSLLLPVTLRPHSRELLGWCGERLTDSCGGGPLTSCTVVHMGVS